MIDRALSGQYAAFMLIVFTDLDGTLLDHKSYSFDAARPALALLKDMGIPLVLVTSKTRAEVEVWRERLDNHDPFIVENGGALYMPRNYFPLTLQAPAHRDGYAVIEFGAPYNELVETLRAASSESQCRVIGFHDMSIQEVSLRCGISMDLAVLAKRREYDEPFEVLDPCADQLLKCIESRKKQWTRGGRFYHILGANDKSHCVRLLTHFYQRAFGEVSTVGLGDGLNDARFLKAVDIPIVIKSAESSRLLAKVPRARLSDIPGSEGWNLAVMEILQNHGNRKVEPMQADSSIQSA
jgi:mannosyl-3-phosphoglycerate phosphatase